jgi:ankyrin repeat protein
VAFAMICLFAILTAATAFPGRVAAQSPRLSLIRDAEIEALVVDYARPLMKAAGLRSGAVEFLIVNGADIDSQDSEEYTPLHNAAWNGHIEAVKLLVNSGADINASTYSGDTPYNCAVAKNHDEVSAFLETLGVIK